MLCADTGVEYAVITSNGRSILIRGDETSTDLPKEIFDDMIKHKGTLDFHTHPYPGDIIPSKNDRAIIEMLENETGQKTSRVDAIDGLFSVFNKDGVVETGVIKRQVDDDYETMLEKIFS